MKKVLIVILMFSLSNQLFSQNYKFGKVSKEELQEEFYKQDSSANAVVLYKKRRTYFKYVQDEGFQVVTDVLERRKIYNSEAFDTATKKIIKIYNSSGARERVSKLKAVTYNLENNKIVKTSLKKSEIFGEKMNKYWTQKKFTMPNVKEGSIIEWKYTITSPFKSIDDVQFQYDIPVKKMDVNIEIPEYFKYNRRSKGYYPVQSSNDIVPRSITIRTKSRKGDNFYTVKTKFSQTKIDYRVFIDIYKINNVPALVEEPYINNIKNYQTAIKYEHSATNWPNKPVKYYSHSWEDITKTIYKNPDFSNQMLKSNHFKEDLAVIIDGVELGSDKIVAILEFVKSKIKWNGTNGITTYNGTKKAYKEGVGNVADINFNLISMLNNSGLKATPVILSTRSHGIPIYPTIEGFNYVIAAVELNSNIVLLDATDLYSTPDNLPLRDLNWKGRLIRKDGTSSFVNLIPTTHSKSESSMSLTLNENGEINGMINNSYTNLRALQYRQKYAKVKDDDIISEIEENIGSIEIGDFRIRNKEEHYKPIVEMFKFFSEDLVEIINEKIYLKPLLFKSKIKNPFKLDRREFPIDFGSPISEINKISIVIPKGYIVEFVPENLGVGLPNGFGTYKFKIEIIGEQIFIISKLDINTAIVPSLNYNEIKEFYKLIINKNKEQIVLKKA